MALNLMVLLGMVCVLISCASGPQLSKAEIKKLDDRIAKHSAQMDRRVN